MDTEWDFMTAWLEVQMEIEELERKFWEELRGISNADNSRSLSESNRGAERAVQDSLPAEDTNTDY